MRRAKSPDGLYHTRDYHEKPSKPKDEERKRKKYEDAQICLSCPNRKSRCRGTQKCIDKRRRELQATAEISVQGASAGTEG